MSIPQVLIEKNHPAEPLAHLLWRAHQHARAAVRVALAERRRSEMSNVAAQAAMDTIYGIDVVAETALLQFLGEYQRKAPPFLLVGEFEQGEALPFGHGAPQFRVLLDPIDGTRLLMHQKSSGWILAGIAPEKGEDTRLSDIFFSLQTELPPIKQIFADTLWASAFSAVSSVRANLLTGEETPLFLPADPATDLRHGFVSFVNLFPRGKALLAKLEEEFLYAQAGANLPAEELTAHIGAIFSDQHLSTGGQLYGLMTGQLRLVVDVRPLLNLRWRRQNEATVLCAHPYDLAAHSIAQRGGVALYSATGARLDGPTDPTAEIGWIGFANQALSKRYLQIILQLLQRFDLIE
ncbi:hypothetical protein L0337_14555 [candidate division KSB1 bacterium]|nr:hypothetical protein [candidate division KSB1 bacterium]